MLASPPVRAAARTVGGRRARVRRGRWRVCVLRPLLRRRLRRRAARLDRRRSRSLLAALAAPRRSRLVARAAARPAGCGLPRRASSALAVWVGLSTIWSLSPDRSWAYTNRTLVYAAFALLGVLARARSLPRPCERSRAAAAVLLGARARLGAAREVRAGALLRLRPPRAAARAARLLERARAARRRRACRSRSGSPRRAARPAFGAASSCSTRAVVTRAAHVLALRRRARVSPRPRPGSCSTERPRREPRRRRARRRRRRRASSASRSRSPGSRRTGSRARVRAHDGWIFALAVARGAARRGRRRVRASRARRRASARRGRRRRVERVGGARRARRSRSPGSSRASSSPAGSGTSSRIPVSSQIGSSTRPPRERQLEQPLALVAGGVARVHAPSGRRHRRRHVPAHRPACCAAARSTTTEPHNMPLQFLGETGIVGFLLFVGAAAAARSGSCARARARAGASARPSRRSRSALAVFLVHMRRRHGLELRRDVRAAAARRRRARRTRARRSRRPCARGVRCSPSARCSFALAAGLLARRAVARAAAARVARRRSRDAKRAHTYDPLSTDALLDWAALEDATATSAARAALPRRRSSLEPENAQRLVRRSALLLRARARWPQAYHAFSNVVARTTVRAGRDAVRPARPGAPQGARRLAA